ncbi:hypothetical protein BCU66_017850 [Vibrio sp. 10N.286.49.B1]|nr:MULTISPECIES: hypothetical protein [unclassified Vibrio]
MVFEKNRQEEKKIAAQSGDHTAGVNDTFACCRSDVDDHITSGIS